MSVLFEMVDHRDVGTIVTIDGRIYRQTILFPTVHRAEVGQLDPDYFESLQVEAESVGSTWIPNSDNQPSSKIAIHRDGKMILISATGSEGGMLNDAEILSEQLHDLMHQCAGQTCQAV
jgi:hypothetical protein